MNSKSIGADMVYAWPSAEIGMMDAKMAAKIMYANADAATITEKAAEYADLQANVTSAARRGYVDTIIQPEDTRKYVIGAFEMLFTKEGKPSGQEARHGLSGVRHMKQRWKKITVLMLTGMLAFSMAACGKEEEDSSAKDQAQFEMIQSDLEMGAEGLTETLTSLTEAEA